ncbi:hypothetical protein KIN20_003507 [Parelaphostrongylus tenuis]|uniref:Uncharacterized protein n=1 Tax=Parelaphostrongylus tenuis TaxID=148309 RepID=A0AAD5QHF9_PARTN|nr:hypothetical protein KIN20_003507 [Parelaphostrongylus tenuis]
MVFSDALQQQTSSSTSRHCHSLQCTVRIESNSSGNRRGTITSKNAALTLGRNLTRSRMSSTKVERLPQIPPIQARHHAVGGSEEIERLQS